MREQKVGGDLIRLWKRGEQGGFDCVARGFFVHRVSPAGRWEQCEAKNLPSPLFFKEGERICHLISGEIRLYVSHRRVQKLMVNDQVSEEGSKVRCTLVSREHWCRLPRAVVLLFARQA